MIYTMLMLIQNVKPSELENHPVIKELPEAIASLSMNDIICKQISQHLPAPYLHPFDPDHIPPYTTILPTNQAYNDIGYVYFKTNKTIPSPALLVSALNDLPQFEDKALFLAAQAGNNPISLMKTFIHTYRNDTQNISDSMEHIVTLYEYALAVQDEVAALIKKQAMNG